MDVHAVGGRACMPAGKVCKFELRSSPAARASNAPPTYWKSTLGIQASASAGSGLTVMFRWMDAGITQPVPVGERGQALRACGRKMHQRNATVSTQLDATGSSPQNSSPRGYDHGAGANKNLVDTLVAQRLKEARGVNNPLYCGCAAVTVRQQQQKREQYSRKETSCAHGSSCCGAATWERVLVNCWRRGFAAAGASGCQGLDARPGSRNKIC